MGLDKTYIQLHRRSCSASEVGIQDLEVKVSLKIKIYESKHKSINANKLQHINQKSQPKKINQIWWDQEDKRSTSIIDQTIKNIQSIPATK